MILTTVIFAQVAAGARRPFEPRLGLPHEPAVSNKPLLAASLVIVGLQLIVIYFVPLHALFEIVPLTAQQLGLTVLAALVILAAGEIEKVIRRSRD